MADTIIEALWNYFLQCPLLEDKKLNIDFLPDKGDEYSIDVIPSTEIVKRYLDGSSKRQYLFVIRSVHDYSSDILQNMTNSGFYEKFNGWLEEQNEKENFPKLPQGKTVLKIEAKSTGYLFTVSPSAGKYQIQCVLTYLQRKEG